MNSWRRLKKKHRIVHVNKDYLVSDDGVMIVILQMVSEVGSSSRTCASCQTHHDEETRQPSFMKIDSLQY